MSVQLELLRRLASGVNAGGAAPRSASVPGAPVGKAIDFAAMLDKARAGGLSSGLSVRVAPGAGVDLSAGQIGRLSAAVDRAEAQGALRAVALMDGQILQVDVPSRTIVGKADAKDARVLTQVDAVLVVPEEGAEQAKAKPLGVPSVGDGKLSPSLLKVLSESRTKNEQAAT